MSGFVPAPALRPFLLGARRAPPPAHPAHPSTAGIRAAPDTMGGFRSHPGASRHHGRFLPPVQSRTARRRHARRPPIASGRFPTPWAASDRIRALRDTMGGFCRPSSREPPGEDTPDGRRSHPGASRHHGRSTIACGRFPTPWAVSAARPVANRPAKTRPTAADRVRAVPDTMGGFCRPSSREPPGEDTPDGRRSHPGGSRHHGRSPIACGRFPTPWAVSAARPVANRPAKTRPTAADRVRALPDTMGGCRSRAGGSRHHGRLPVACGRFPTRRAVSAARPVANRPAKARPTGAAAGAEA